MAVSTVLGGNVIVDDSATTTLSDKRRSGSKGYGSWFSLLYLVVGAVVATLHAYKFSLVFGGFFFILGVFLVLWEVLKLSKGESKASMIADTK